MLAVRPVFAKLVTPAPTVNSVNEVNKAAVDRWIRKPDSLFEASVQVTVIWLLEFATACAPVGTAGALGPEGVVALAIGA